VTTGWPGTPELKYCGY